MARTLGVIAEAMHELSKAVHATHRLLGRLVGVATPEPEITGEGRFAGERWARAH